MSPLNSTSVIRVEIRELEMPLVRPFLTSKSVQRTRQAMMVRVVTECSEGWADLSVEDVPIFGHEYLGSTWPAMRDHFVPALFEGPASTPHYAERIVQFLGHPAARCSVLTALVDAELRTAGVSLSRYLGGVRDRVEVGVSVGIPRTLDALVEEVKEYVEAGYRRVKLKVRPGWDSVPLRRLRSEFGPALILQVDGNGAYGGEHLAQLRRLERHDLAMIEQPFPAADLNTHARLVASTSTPVCLDESIGSAREALDAIDRGACDIVNIKAARVGGYEEARRIHDLCRTLGIPVWCGGMLESGVGRAANLALASLPGFVLPSDISATDRYFRHDVTPDFVLEDGFLRVPDGPGIGVEVDLDTLERFTVRTEILKA